MTLNAINFNQKDTDGKHYEVTEFNLGEHYKVAKNTVRYPDGNIWTSISVYVSYEDRHDNYIPEIYYHDDLYGKSKPRFVIQTISYGALASSEIEKVIAGYQEAVKAVEILTKNFC